MYIASCKYNLGESIKIRVENKNCAEERNS